MNDGPGRIHFFDAFCLGVILSFVGIGIFISYTDQAMFDGIYVLEDGLVEWSTFYLLLILMLTSWVKLGQLWSQRTWWFRFCLLVAGFIFLFGAGEEISWGQRIFRWSAPQYFMENNTQQETTLHNLVIGGVRLNKVVFGSGLGIFIGLYLLVLPRLYRSKQWLKKIVDASAIPLAQIHHVISFIIMFASVSVIHSGKRGELFEFAGVFLFWLIFLFPYNKSAFQK